jgi:glycosyltransferase involved in cell wall biosynthesis
MYSVRRASEPRSPPRAFTPLQVEERELSEPLAAVRPAEGPGGAPYAAARVLVRLHTQPIGALDVPLPAGGLEPDALARAIGAALGGQLRRHLAHDALQVPGSLESGVGGAESPRCLDERRAALADPPFATVVVPTRDRPELLCRCLGSVLASDYPERRFEVVVADNAPTGAHTRELVERANDDRVAYLLAPRPGSGSARNAGAARAGGEIVAFVDDDAVVDRHWLAELVAGFRAPGGVACVTGLVVAAELDTWAQQLFEEYGGFSGGFEGAIHDLLAHRADDPLFPYNPGILGSGNNVAFQRAALLELGGYDPCLGNGTPARSGEDWELFLRLFRRGCSAAYRPGAIAYHRHRRGFEELRAQIHDYGIGMAAALTRTVAHEPAAILEIGRRFPRAARYALGARSAKNRNHSGGYPRELRRAELTGLARGPAAYLRSRRASR